MAALQPPSALAQALGQVPNVTKGLALGVLPLGYLLQLVAPGAKAYLGLVAGKTLACIWMIVTSGLLEDNLLSCLVFSAALVYVGRIVEPLHGSREFLRFLLVSLAATGAATFLAVTAFYYATVTAEKSSSQADHVGAILYTPICGFHGAFAALLVALKQLLPDSEVALLGGLVRCRVKHLPSIYVTLLVVLSVVLRQMTKFIPFVVFGTYSAWTYLRFFKPDPSGLRGDPSEDFKFASFFPPPAQPAVERVSGAVSNITRLAPQASTGLAPGVYVLGGGAPGGGGTQAGGDSSDAARRRERGARALEERLGLKAKAQAQAASSAAPAAPAAAPAASGGGQAATAPAVDVEQPAQPAPAPAPAPAAATAEQSAPAQEAEAAAAAADKAEAGEA